MTQSLEGEDESTLKKPEDQAEDPFLYQPRGPTEFLKVGRMNMSEVEKPNAEFGMLNAQ
jgi:hypothetical protein